MSAGPEATLLREIRVELGREKDLVLWRNQVGFATYENKHGVQRVPYGLCVGSSDLVGIGPGARFFALEVKSDTGSATKEQKLFIELVRRRGGFAAVVRSVDEARAALERARAGECS